MGPGAKDGWYVQNFLIISRQITMFAKFILKFSRIFSHLSWATENGPNLVCGYVERIKSA
jgi:hypothetical protein